MATNASGFVANTESDSGSPVVYPFFMLSGWLREALDRSGVKQAELARRLTEKLGRSIDRAAVNKMASGTRAIAGDELLEIERITGLGAPSDIEVPLVGFVGAGATAHFYIPGQDEIDRVHAPKDATPRTVAVQIRGESLGPLFDTWLCYYDDVRSPVTHDMIGVLCVVGLNDDRVLIKRIRRSKTPGLFHLESNTEPTILDVEIAWAAKVKSIEPR